MDTVLPLGTRVRVSLPAVRGASPMPARTVDGPIVGTQRTPLGACYCVDTDDGRALSVRPRDVVALPLVRSPV